MILGIVRGWAQVDPGITAGTLSSLLVSVGAGRRLVLIWISLPWQGLAHARRDKAYTYSQQKKRSLHTFIVTLDGGSRTWDFGRRTSDFGLDNTRGRYRLGSSPKSGARGLTSD
jgi:hypothetical protein